MALTVPVEVPMKSARPERDMAIVVQTTSLVRTSLRICSKNIHTDLYLRGSFMVLFNQSIQMRPMTFDSTDDAMCCEVQYLKMQFLVNLSFFHT